MKKRLLNIVCFYGEAGCRYGGGAVFALFSHRGLHVGKQETEKWEGLHL